MMPSLFTNRLLRDFEDFDRMFASNTNSDYFIDEDESRYSLSVDMPGIKKSDLKLEIKGRTLVIQCESKGKRTRKYHRIFSVPTKTDMENIEANLEDGVLTIKMNKTIEKPRLVQIK